MIRRPPSSPLFPQPRLFGSMLKIWGTKTKKDPFPPMAELYDHIRKAPVVKREDSVKKGDVEGAFKTAARMVEAEYEWPFQSHASMGPACAVADVRADGATVWTGSQKPHFVQTGEIGRASCRERV